MKLFYLRYFMVQQEHIDQSSVVTWFRFQYPQGLIYAIPNSATRSIKQTLWLRKEGLTAGVPDLCIPMPRGIYHGMYIEMKAGKNKTTDAQNEWLQKLADQGYYCVVCYGSEVADAQIKRYMSLHSSETML